MRNKKYETSDGKKFSNFKDATSHQNTIKGEESIEPKYCISSIEPEYCIFQDVNGNNHLHEIDNGKGIYAPGNYDPDGRGERWFPRGPRFDAGGL